MRILPAQHKRIALGLGCSLICAVANAQRGHPLDPLSADEIASAVAVVRADARAGSEVRFALIDLAEPDKQQVLDALRRGSSRRAARALLYDWETRTTGDVIVDLDSASIRRWDESANSEPPFRRLIISRLNEVAKADAGFRAAMAAAGIEDLSRVNLLASVDDDVPLDVGPGGDRFVRGNAYMMDERIDGMGAPISVVVNLTRGEVADLNRQAGRWTGSDRTAPERGREALAPLDIVQAEGPSFTIEGHEIRWQNWRLHYGVHPRRGLELYDVRYRDAGEERPILYRASVAETITPYGDPEWIAWYPIDEGDYGFGIHGIRSAVPGADAPPNAIFRDAVLHDHAGVPYAVPRAVTVFERDAGVLWRHAAESRRARELVVAFYSTVDNYDYVFNWILRQDGSIRVEVQLTGIINYGTTRREREPPFGTDTSSYRTLVAPGITGPLHQHFFSYRLDFDVDGSANTVIEVETATDPIDAANPDGHWFATRERVLTSEAEAQRLLDPAAARNWRVVNEARTGALGRPTAYALMPGANVAPAAQPTSPSRRKMRFVDRHLWVTQFDPNEMHPGGDLLTPGATGQGLPAWTAADRDLRDADVVLWYTLGMTHVVRPEDFPIMPTHTVGFSLVPFGFFDENPALDVAPSP
jgi:primary-amine oxidase